MEINIAICDDMEDFNKVLYLNLQNFAKDTSYKFNIQSYSSGSSLFNKIIEGYVQILYF